MHYPENGVGYDNYVYRTYFGVKYTTGISIEEDTYTFVNVVDAIDLEALNEWLSWDTSDESKQEKLVAYAKQLTEARLYCNNARESATQAQYVTAERLEKLEKAEGILREVKARFGMYVGVQELKIASYAVFKSEYKAGEVFDGTGLVAVLVYTDGSQIDLDVSELSLEAKYKEPLKASTQYVKYTYGDDSLIVRIKVVADGDSSSSQDKNENTPSKDKNTGCGSEMGLPMAMIALIGGAVLFKKKEREN